MTLQEVSYMTFFPPVKKLQEVGASSRIISYFSHQSELLSPLKSMVKLLLSPLQPEFNFQEHIHGSVSALHLPPAESSISPQMHPKYFTTRWKSSSEVCKQNLISQYILATLQIHFYSKSTPGMTTPLSTLSQTVRTTSTQGCTTRGRLRALPSVLMSLHVQDWNPLHKKHLSETRGSTKIIRGMENFCPAWKREGSRKTLLRPFST